METKKITLRSQTVQCPHCGEYYSVTYKYCPFCDVGRQEEEKRLAEKKKKKQAFFGNLFGSAEPEKKKARPKSASQPAPGPEAEAEAPARRERPAKERPVREHTPKEPAGKEPAAKERAGKEAAPKKPATRRHGPRKKTSEMTEEEKAIALAEREARAAARKRERDRLAREAALAAAEEAALQPTQPAEAPAQVEVSAEGAPVVEPGPVFEEVTVPETFGFSDAPLVETDPAAFAQAPVSAEGPVVVQEPTPAQSQDIPTFAAEPDPAEEAARKQWEAIRALDPLAAAGDSAAPVIPEMPQPVATEIQVGEGPMAETVTPAAPGAPAAAPEKEAAPAQAEKPVETEEDLDALLSEIRDLLSESPVPKLTPDQLQKPAQPVPEVQLQEASAEVASAAPAAQEPAPAQPAEEPAPPVQAVPQEMPEVEEPTIPIPTQEAWQAIGQEKAEPAPQNDLVDNEPTIPIPTQEIAEELQEVPPQEEDFTLNPAVLPPRETPLAESKPEGKEPPHAGKKAKKAKKKGGGPNVFLIVLSLVIVVAAVFIVVRNVVPAFQDGLFSFGQTKEAESVTLDQTELSLAEAGATATLSPTFAPEGTTATLTWTSSDTAVATVDEQGLVTAVAPGAATITATMENGQKAECQVTCTWGDTTATDPNTDSGDGTDPNAAAKPALSANDITLDSAGATRQITVTGATGDVTWTSGDSEIATVAADGTITAVAPGRTTVTAKVGDVSLNCAVRCIW